MNELFNVLSFICLLLGSICNIVAGIGIMRFPDFYSRMHASGVTDTLGAGLILLGLMLQCGWDITLSKLILILVFTLLTSPTIGYTLANAATLSNLKAQKGDAITSEKNVGE